MIEKAVPTIATVSGVGLAGMIPENNLSLILQITVILFNVVSEILKHKKIKRNAKK